MVVNVYKWMPKNETCAKDQCSPLELTYILTLIVYAALFIILQQKLHWNGSTYTIYTSYTVRLFLGKVPNQWFLEVRLTVTLSVRASLLHFLWIILQPTKSRLHFFTVYSSNKQIVIKSFSRKKAIVELE